MINWTDAIDSMMADVKKQIQDAELRATQFAMDAKNAKDRAALLEAQVKDLTSSYQNACAVGDNLKEQMLKIARHLENSELAIEALKAKLKRKNGQIQRLTEANAGYNKGIRRLRKRISDMEQAETVNGECRREMLERVMALSEQNEQFRKDCAQSAMKISLMQQLLDAYRELARRAAEIEKKGE